MRVNFRLKTFGLVILSGFIFLTSCTKKEELVEEEEEVVEEIILDDNAYFAAAKEYLTYNLTFGPQTDVASHQYRKKIEFNSAMNSPSGLFLADVLTSRKTFITNPENNLILLKRLEASRKDGTTMTVSLMSGQNRSRVNFHRPEQGGRQKSYVVDQCERIVFNAIGEAVCLNVVDKKIVMTKIAQKFSQRLITSCRDTGSAISCSGTNRHKILSRKSLDLATDELTIYDMVIDPIPL